MVFWPSPSGTSGWLLQMFVFCSDPPQRAPAIAHVCFCPALTKRTLQSITKIVLLPSERPPDLLKEQSETYISRQSELLSIFFLRWSFIHYCSNTHEQARAHTHTDTCRATLYSLYITLSSFEFFLFTFMTQYSTVSSQLRVPVPWGARAFAVWPLHVSVWLLPNYWP